MALKVQREGATPNLIKYSVLADQEGGEFVLSQEDLVRDCVSGPLRAYFARGVKIADAEAACRYLLCNPAMRAFVTPQSFPRVAVVPQVEGQIASIALKIMAEPNAAAIVALEFRHTLAA